MVLCLAPRILYGRCVNYHGDMSSVNVRTSTAPASPWVSYQRMRIRLTSRINRELFEKTGLSEADCEVLLSLVESPDESVRDLALRCGLEWEKSRLSHQLRRMEQRGLVERGTCSEDGRGSTVTLTAKGRSAAQAGRKVQEDAVRRFVSNALTPEQYHQLGVIAETILAATEEPHQP